MINDGENYDNDLPPAFIPLFPCILLCKPGFGKRFPSKSQGNCRTVGHLWTMPNKANPGAGRAEQSQRTIAGSAVSNKAKEGWVRL